MGEQFANVRLSVANKTLGWSDCGHNDWREGAVLIVEWGTEQAGQGDE